MLIVKLKLHIKCYLWVSKPLSLVYLEVKCLLSVQRKPETAK